MTTVGYIGLALVVLLVMITIHELGHYLVGKMLGFKINEFAVGFGKALFSKKLKSGEVFSIRLIPLGGYCAFAGEDEDDNDPRAFNNKKPWRRLLVQFAGVFFNFAFAVVTAFILLVGFGYDIPKVANADKNIEYVTAYNELNPTTQLDALQNGDIIRKVDGTTISFASGNDYSVLMKKYEINDRFVLTVQRAGEAEWVELEMMKFADPSDATNTAGVIGVGITPYRYTFWEALLSAIPVAAAMAWKVLVFLAMLLTGGIALSDIGGPITTIGVIAEYSQTNIANLFIFLPFISANLAVFNLLPIPSLDGSRMIFTGIEWIRKKPINRKVEAAIHFGGLVVLFAFVIFVDVFNIFH